MARITWQNVDAPNFSGVNDSYRTMSQLLGNATQSGLGMIDTYNRAQSDVADRAIQQRLMGITDPSQFNAQDVIGGSGNRASMAMLKAVEGQGATLVDRANKADSFKRNAFDNSRYIAGIEQTDAASPILNQAQMLASQGKVAEANALIPSDFRDDLYRGALSSNNNTFNNSYSQTTTNRSLEDIAIGDQVTALEQEIWANGTDGPSRLQAFGEATKGITNPRVIASLRNRLGSQHPAEFGFQGGTGAAGSAIAGAAGGSNFSGVGSGFAPSAPGMAGTGKGNPYDVVVGFGKYGNSDKPITSMTMGEAVQFGKNVLIPSTRNKSELGLSGGKGSSAMGAFQITQETLKEFAPKAIGADWESKPMSPENQEKIAEAIFNARKGGNLKETWQGLTNTKVGAYASKSWEDVRQEIAGREVGATLQALSPQEVNNSQRDLAVANDEANSGSPAARLIATIGDGAYADAVAKKLAESFPDATEIEIERGLKRLMYDGGYTAKQAGALMLHNRSEMERNPLNPMRWLPFLGKRFDDSTDISGKGGKESYQTMLAQASSNENRQIASQTIAEATQLVSQVTSQIQQVQTKIDALGPLPGLKKQLEQLTQKRATLIQTQKAAVSVQGNTKGLTSKATQAELQEKRVQGAIAAALEEERAKKSGSMFDELLSRLPKSYTGSQGSYR